MADIYVRSTDGLDTDDGSTWALAKATITAAIAAAVAGDRILVSSNHAETGTSNVTWAFAGTVDGGPVTLTCADDTSQPPTASASTATYTNQTTLANLTFTGTVELSGFNITLGLGSATSSFTALGASGGHMQKFKDCKFIQTTGSTAQRFYIGNSSTTNSGAQVVFDNVSLKSPNALTNIVINSPFIWRNSLGFLAGSATPNPLFSTGITYRQGKLVVEAVDFSNLASTVVLMDAYTGGNELDATFRNCKLPSTWTGTLFNAAPIKPGIKAAMHNCTAGSTKYGLWVEDYAGVTRDEAIIVRTGGATDGTTPIAWKLASSTRAKYPLITLETPEISIWNYGFGTQKTLTVEILHDSQGAGAGGAFQDDEIWLEVQYVGESGYGTFISDSKADVLAAAADQTSSSASWNTHGMTAPVTQKLSVTFTPQERGYLQAKVVMAKASKTCYVCPKVVVS